MGGKCLRIFGTLVFWCVPSPSKIVASLNPGQLWDMMEGKELLQHIHDHQGRYDAKLHIAKIIALFGPLPPEVIQRYHYMREYSWPQAVRREDDRVCETAATTSAGHSLTIMVLLSCLSRTGSAQHSKHLRLISLRRPDLRPKTRRHSFLPSGRGEGRVSGSRQGNACLASKCAKNGRRTGGASFSSTKAKQAPDFCGCLLAE